MIRIHSDKPCCRCLQTIPAGTQVERSGRGWNEQYRHPHCSPAPQSPVVTGEPVATERQIRYALDLQTLYWTPAVFGGRRYTETELRVLSRTHVSDVIDTLLSERDVQVGG